MHASLKSACCVLAVLLVSALLPLSLCDNEPTTASLSPADDEPDSQSLHDLLGLRMNTALPELSHTVHRRQANVSTNTSSCTDFEVSLLLQSLNDSCVDSLSRLNIASPIYTASDLAVRDIATVCRDDCAGEVLEFDEACPEYYPDIATYLRAVCSLNSNMDRCAFSVAQNDGSQVFQKCFVETNAFEQCRRRCKNALAEFSSDIGCCVNTFYNDTWDFFGNLKRLHPTLNYSTDPFLWEICGVPYPNECSNDLFPSPTSSTVAPSTSPTPTNTPTRSSPNTTLCSDTKGSLDMLDKTCQMLLTEFTSTQRLQILAKDERKMSELCSPDCGGQYYKHCSSDSSTHELLRLFCGEFSNKRCGNLLLNSYSTLLENLTVCNNISETESRPCSDECRLVLENAETQYGCCLFGLMVESVSERAGVDVVNDQLWSQCGLDQPHQCPNPFITETNETKAPGKGTREHSTTLEKYGSI